MNPVFSTRNPAKNPAILAGYEVSKIAGALIPPKKLRRCGGIPMVLYQQTGNLAIYPAKMAGNPLSGQEAGHNDRIGV